MKNVLKVTVFSAFLVLGVFSAAPKAHAIDFNPLNPIDPFCLFSCSKPQPTTINNTVGSYNTNSFNNNTGSFNGSLNNQADAATPSYHTSTYQTSPYGAQTYYSSPSPVPSPVITYVTQPVSGSNTNSNYNYNYNYTTGGGTNYAPAYSAPTYYEQPRYEQYYPTYYHTQPYAPTYPVYTQPVYQQPVYYNQPISYTTGIQVACAADTVSTRVGVPMTWSAEATLDGNANGFAFSWSGTEGLYGYQSNAIMTYYSTGVKSAIVTVTAPNGLSASKVCSNTVTVKSNTVAKVVKKTTPKAAPVIVLPPPPTQVVTPANLFSLGNVPWGWVGILIILVLLGVIFYLSYNKKKI